MREILRAAAAMGLATRDGKVAGQETPPKLKTTEFPDGTGSIGLAPGWNMDGAYRGACGCKGPNSAYVLMGMSWVILRPEHPVTKMPENPGGATARFGDLHGALREVIKNNKNRLVSVRSRPAPSGLPGVPAVYYLYEIESKGKRITALGYFSSIGNEADTTLSYWQLYSSAVMAPKERFMKDLPTMMAMWDSWRPNGKKPKAGSESAMLDAVIEKNQKMRSDTLKSQQESFDRMNAKFREVINN